MAHSQRGVRKGRLGSEDPCVAFVKSGGWHKAALLTNDDSVQRRVRDSPLASPLCGRVTVWVTCPHPRRERAVAGKGALRGTSLRDKFEADDPFGFNRI